MSSKKHCRCPCTANAEKTSLYIGIIHFLLSSASIVGCVFAAKNGVHVVSQIIPKDQFFTSDVVEHIGLQVLIFASVVSLIFSALLVLGIRRQKSCGAKAFFLHGLVTLTLCIAFTTLCVINAYLHNDLIRIVPHIIFIFLYILYGMELAVVHRAFLNIDETNAYQPLITTKHTEN